MEILPVGAEIFHTDRRTDVTKLIAVFVHWMQIMCVYCKNTIPEEIILN